ncbi:MULTISPECIES: TadE/TadG family type IV pilus assembly protein [Roseobacteraceae]|uniref:Putative Flp pilus-assembly TadE/G-like protein n=1 Tax=Pseudosulfitobacter pseudonitzschiae TaxID=1402135 RepID=A0A221K2W2_9RHOB|nr:MULTISPECIES: TadE/TadG family type IV pilus assembly protein [Roseobacteraceae]ASM73336.1 putative Flp pilus-assembly TadE/G-like protein [Pseudosulfitobacter pseudonitzschiae]
MTRIPHDTTFGSACVRTNGVAKRLRGFVRDDDGSMTIFACFLLMMMLLVGGIGIDLMRNEMERTRLQNTMDRAVLAAADLDQELSPEAVVTDYFEKSGLGSYLNSVTVNEGLNFRTVTANASTKSPTRFMRLMGVPELHVPAVGQASERIANVEISLVLDISGSMASNSKIYNLRNAASVFVDTVIRPETEDLVSLSLVPYSEHVNVGEAIFNELWTRHIHNFSHCLEIPDAEFSNASFNLSRRYDQMQHFQWNYDGRNNDRSDTVCPRYSYETVTPLSQNAYQLKQQISQFQPRAGTSIFLGMKWATALLDPSFRPVVTSLIGKNDIDSEFTGRPVSYDDIETLKTIILMTDGKNDRSNRIADWAYDSSSDYVHWNNYNFNWYLSRYVNSRDYRYYYESNHYTATQGDYLLDNICDAAKDKGIVIWAIGFEVDEHGANEMKNCASTPSHFFRVEGVEITEAFKAIARTINQLRLTQ